MQPNSQTWHTGKCLPLTAALRQYGPAPWALLWCLWGEGALAAPSVRYTLVPDTARLRVQTPALADRQIEKLLLNNGLRVYLVSDPGLTVSAAAVGVRAGAWQEPATAPGLAHLLEHMVFLGSAAYPGAATLNQYLADHDGSANATTGVDRTVYALQVNTDAFPGALERFAALLANPQLDDASVKRERAVVDAELHGLNSSDSHCEQMVLARLANPGHPQTFASVGREDQLAPIRGADLRAWMTRYYSANLMTLVLHSPLPPATLRDLAARLFSALPNRRLPAPRLATPLLNPALQAHLIHIEPRAAAAPRLTLQWEIPWRDIGEPGAWAADIIGLALSTGTAGGLVDSLRAAGLAEDVTAYAQRQATGSAQMFVNVSLTDAGAQDIAPVMDAVFAALAQLRREGISPALWQALHDQNIREFQDQEREDTFWTTHDWASHLVDAPLASFPDAIIAPAAFDRAASQALIDMLTADRCHVVLMAPSALSHRHSEQVEAETGTRFSVRALPVATLTRLREMPAGHFTWLVANAFLPTAEDHRVLPMPETKPSVRHPVVLMDDAAATLFWARDEPALTPRVAWRFLIKTPLFGAGQVREQALADLYVAIINQHLATLDDSAAQAGLSYELRATEEGIVIKLLAYRRSAIPLLQALLAALRNTPIDARGFAGAKTHLQGVYDAHGKSTPFDDLDDAARSVTQIHPIPKSARAAALGPLTQADLENFRSALFRAAFHIQGAMVGNMDSVLATQAQHALQGALGTTPYPVGRQSRRSRDLSTMGNTVIRRRTAAPSSLVSVSLYAGKQTPGTYAQTQVLQQFINTRFFDALRTRQYAGYLVDSGTAVQGDNVMFEFVVQPEHHSVDDVLERIESFVSQSAVEPLSAEQFDRIKASLLQQLATPASNVSASTDRLYDLAFHRHRQFGFYDDAARALTALTYQQFITWNGAVLGPANAHRMVILVDGAAVSAQKKLAAP